MRNGILVFVIPVVLALALLGAWDVFTKYRDWLVKHQPRTTRGRRLALAVGILLIVGLLTGTCAEMFRIA